VQEVERQVPDLIKALRLDARLYQEALALFRKFNTFILSERNDLTLGEMSKEAILPIEKVKIEFRYVHQKYCILKNV
jgi:hypothetical protein